MITSDFTYLSPLNAADPPNTVDLKVTAFLPDDHDPSEKRNAMIFMYAGGFTNGGPASQDEHAAYFLGRGLYCFQFRYRTTSVHSSTPFDSIRDMRAAVRFIKKNGALWGIDGQKIILWGDSVGGHGCLAADFQDQYEHDGQDLSVSTLADCLVLVNPTLDYSVAGWGHSLVISSDWHSFSPLLSGKA